MQALTPASSTVFAAWLIQAPRPHVGMLRGRMLTIDDAWEVNLRQNGRLLHDLWLSHGGTRLLWTLEGIVADLIKHTRTTDWEWVRSATTAWRVLHSVKGRPLPADIRAALSEVLKDQGAARFALDTTRLEAFLATSTARGICVDTDALHTARAEMTHTHKLLIDLMGFDPLPDETRNLTLAWLTRHGIHVDGIASDDWGSRTVADTPLAREAESTYEHALRLRRRLPKVHELTAHTKRGKVHTRLTPAAQVSGRISSTRPALNNLAADQRHFLIARPGHVLVTADFDGIEPRVLGALSGDTALINDLATGDPYADAAARAGYDPATNRNRFKVVMISTMYGAQPGRTARQLRCSIAEAVRVRSLLWEKYPQAASWLRAESGFKPYRLDSGRPLGVIERDYARPNLIIQSTAYDIFQAAAIRVFDGLPPKSHISLPLHDELIIETPETTADAVLQTLATHMPTTFRDVPIEVSPAVLGKHWRKV